MVEKARAGLEAGEALLANGKEWDKAKNREAKELKKQEAENQKAEVLFWRQKAQSAASSSRGSWQGHSWGKITWKTSEQWWCRTCRYKNSDKRNR